MSVNASFEPGRLASEPGMAAALTLRLHNEAPTDAVVKLRAAGELARQTVLQTETVHLDPAESFDVAVMIDVGAGLTAGPHSSTIEVLNGDGAVSASADATIDVLESMAYAVRLVPEHSRSATAGRHKVTIQNTGNTPVLAELTPETDDDVTIELATQVVNVYPGDTAKVELRAVPPSRFWNGPKRTAGFQVHVATNDGATHDLDGVFEQGPRLRPWIVPASVGAVLALLLGTAAWFLFLKPYVDTTAEQAADLAVAELLADIERAAAEAEELPLGEPADLRLEAAPAPGAAASETFAVSADRVLSVTDVVFQNPTGATGSVALLRSGVVLLESELANFRDLDFHFVAPLRFDGSTTVELRVTCTTPGPNEATCPVAATIIGFVDQAR